MTKEEKIKEAYGEFWQRLSEEQKLFALAYDGAVQIGYSEKDKQLFKDIVKSGLFDQQPTRPKSLQGIKNNNGWTKIKNGNSITLPEYKKGDIYEVWNIETESGYPCRFTAKEVKKQFDYKHITHYRLVERTKFPIY